MTDLDLSSLKTRLAELAPEGRSALLPALHAAQLIAQTRQFRGRQTTIIGDEDRLRFAQIFRQCSNKFFFTFTSNGQLNHLLDEKSPCVKAMPTQRLVPIRALGLSSSPRQAIKRRSCKSSP